MSSSAFASRPQRLGCRKLLCQGNTCYELRICTNRTCKRQGSEQVMTNIGSDARNWPKPLLRCLLYSGNCGSGPNVVLLPNKQLFKHVATPNDVVQVIQTFCGSSVDDTVLQATQLRLAGNAAASQSDLPQALQCYSAAIDLRPLHGLHLLYCNRSAVQLQMGDVGAALEDARRAAELAPAGFHTAIVRLVDALYAAGRYGEAAEECRGAVQRDSSFAFRDEYRVIKRALQSAGQPV
ncbi:hypothetical protein Agub_g5530 [Astrephomene gubernaculifera]|uniref:Uncharacterized protein n=1 Tax=Astrephomene gubernaculifera TaxID=47775 RepID=A0AAD3DPG8_9CHLO|nr:hypothetical protein Agub_g5530 [Astrephomene gubernaculifera]